MTIDGHFDRIDRRAALGRVGIVAAASLGTSLAPGSIFGQRSAPHRPTDKLGFSLYGMKSLSIRQALPICATIGYGCVEIPVMSGWPADSTKLSADQRADVYEALLANQLRLTSIMEHLPLLVPAAEHQANLKRLALAADLARTWSPSKPAVIETILGGRPDRWETDRGDMVKRLRQWADVLAEKQIVLAIKAHVGGAMHLPEHPVWLVDQVNSPWIKCAYDFSHFQLRAVDMQASIATMGKHIRFVHVKDARGDAGHVQFLLPGDGTTDYQQLIRRLRAAGYNGDVVVEVSGQIHGKAGYDPRRAAERSYRHLAGIVAARKEP